MADRTAFLALYPRVAPTQRHLLHDITTTRQNDPPITTPKPVKRMPDLPELVEKYVAKGKSWEEAHVLAHDKIARAAARIR